MEESLILRKDWFVIANGQHIEEYYNLESSTLLGSGAFGKVVMAKQKNTDITRAIKIIPKNIVKKVSKFTNEKNILITLDHPNIIKLYETYEDDNNYYMIFELCRGGELFDTIIDNGYFSEKKTKTIFKCIMKDLHHCHTNGICHRDIKSENFMFGDKTDFESLKMIDFGLSTVFRKNDKDKNKENVKGFKGVKNTKKKPTSGMKTKAGTSYYVAPEVLLGQYNEKCDIWSAGVILYILLCGYPPFGGSNDWEILLAVKRGKYSLKGLEWKHVSESAKDLIKRMLCPMDIRFSAQEVLNHPWFEQDTSDIKGEINLSKLKDYVKSNKLKKVVLNYMLHEPMRQKSKIWSSYSTNLMLTAMES